MRSISAVSLHYIIMNNKDFCNFCDNYVSSRLGGRIGWLEVVKKSCRNWHVYHHRNINLSTYYLVLRHLPFGTPTIM